MNSELVFASVLKVTVQYFLKLFDDCSHFSCDSFQGFTKQTARLLSIESLLFFIVLFAELLFWHAVVISKSLVGSLN